MRLPRSAPALLLAALLLTACIMPPAPRDAEPAADAAATEQAEPEPEPADPLPVIVRSLPAAANVRSGPGTEHAALFHVLAGDELEATGRTADGIWLQVAFEGRNGWIFRTLTDIDADTLANLPATAGTGEITETPTPTAPAAEKPPADTGTDPAADTEAPAPEPTPEPPPAVDDTVRVIGNPVNLRLGPGTHYARDGQVHAGDRLRVTGRNADGTWLQVEHPDSPDARRWIHTPLTSLHPAAARVRFAEAPLPAAAPTPAPAAVEEPQPQPQQPAQEPAPAPVAADCTRRHTINPNETQLSQITDWYGLDLAAVAALNNLDAEAPLQAGTVICLEGTAPAVPPAGAATPAPAPGGACQTPIGPQSCIHIPDFPERGHPNAPIGPIVESASPYVWHAPGTYERDLPGLDYDFELVFTDISVMWDWTVRDFEGCYDALRAHMGVVPQEFGLQRMELRLADSFTWVDPNGETHTNWKEFHWRENGIYFSPQAAVDVPWLEWPNWDPAALPHPDVGMVQYGCYLQPDELAVCDIVPWWGNSHSIHVNAAAARAMANTVMYMSNNALANRYRSRLHERVLQADAYLFPLLDTRAGDPAGHGPCADLWRAG